MNRYKKYCPNVFVAQCEQEHKKGDTIIMTTKYGKEHEVTVHNLVANREGFYFYSITRNDGFNNQERASRKVEKLSSWANSAKNRSDKHWEASNEGKDFLVLAEPIKIGHHSEKRHRALIERNHKRMDNAMMELKKAEIYEQRTHYWEEMAKKIDLSMPESIEFFKMQLEEATEYHKGLKSGEIEKQHSYSLPYATKKLKELKGKYDIAIKLWGN